MQILTIRTKFKAFKWKFEFFERDSKHSYANSYHSKGIQSFQNQIQNIRKGFEAFKSKFEWYCLCKCFSMHLHGATFLHKYSKICISCIHLSLKAKSRCLTSLHGESEATGCRHWLHTEYTNYALVISTRSWPGTFVWPKIVPRWLLVWRPIKVLL